MLEQAACNVRNLDVTFLDQVYIIDDDYLCLVLAVVGLIVQQYVS